MPTALESPQNETFNSTEEILAENTLEKLEQEAENFRRDEELQQFIRSASADLGKDVDISDQGMSEEEFLRAVHSVLDTRNGKDRNDAANVEYGEVSLGLLDILKRKYAMSIDSEPKEPDFDMALIHGGAADTPWRRLKYMLQLMESGKVNTNTIVMLASERPVGQAELDKAAKSGHNNAGKPAKTEFDLAKNAASEQLGIADDEWEIIEGYDPSIPEQHRHQHKYQIAYAEKDGKHVFVPSAPMIGEDRLHPDGNRRNRSNTADTMEMIARMLHGSIQDGRMPKVIASTDAVFQFQRPDGESRLAPLNVEYQQVGYSRETAGMPEWPPRYYAQELWSLINQTFKARDYLRSQADSKV